MGGLRVSRKSLKEPDEFISFSSRLLKQALMHKTKILLGAGVLLGVLVLFSVINYFSNKSENRGSLLLTRLMHQYDKAVTEKGPQKAYELVQPDIQMVIDNYAGKDCGKFARLSAAHYSFRAGKFDGAAALYLQAMNDFNSSPLLKNMAAFGLGYAYEAQKEYEKAVQLFEKLSGKPDMLMDDEALFTLGRLYGLLGKKDLQVKVLSQLSEKHPNSIYTELATNELAG
ncbi:MAG: tetratricopeptide repeat protein [Desulfobacterales bacterium]|jgi:tetratricopeptide (TPR) repeat protein|nr:tetratricopeptide repeat protein [Desulfobacterales bacterium]